MVIHFFPCPPIHAPLPNSLHGAGHSRIKNKPVRGPILEHDRAVHCKLRVMGSMFIDHFKPLGDARNEAEVECVVVGIGDLNIRDLWTLLLRIDAAPRTPALALLPYISVDAPRSSFVQ